MSWYNWWNFYRAGFTIAFAIRSVAPIRTLDSTKYVTPALGGARKISIALLIQSLNPRLQGAVAHTGQDAPPTGRGGAGGGIRTVFDIVHTW